MRTLVFVAALAMLAGPAHAYRGGYYRSVDGSMVHGPTRGNQDYGPVTARCRDGTRSFSHHHRGTCSHHGGVAR
jgi:hypothetical protein